jgi:hypothetical protein
VVVTMVVVVDVVVAVDLWRVDVVTRVRVRAPAPETPLRMTSTDTTSATKCPRCMRRVPFSRHREVSAIPSIALKRSATSEAGRES